MKKLITLIFLIVAANLSFAAELKLTWKDNSDNEDAFSIERSTDGENFAQIATTGPNVEAYTDSGLSPGIRYWYRIRAANSAGYSGYSNVRFATTKAIPNAPDGVNIEEKPVLSIVTNPDGSVTIRPAEQ